MAEIMLNLHYNIETKGNRYKFLINTICWEIKRKFRSEERGFVITQT